MQEELLEVLTSSAAVSAIVPRARINWVQHPQGEAYPAIILHLIGNADGLTMQGPDGLWQGRVQCDCYAAVYREGVELGAAVRTTLHGYRGGGFRGVFLDRTWSAQETGASDRPFRISMDFMTNWRRQDG